MADQEQSSKEMTKIHKTTIRHILREIDPEARLTENALLRFQDIVTDFVRMSSADMVKAMKHRNAKTINESDVVFATS